MLWGVGQSAGLCRFTLSASKRLVVGERGQNGGPPAILGLLFVAGDRADTISGLVVPGTDIDFGAFISACINFLIVAFVVFLLVKAVNKAQNLGEKLTGKEDKRPLPNL